jgi:DNA-binding NarL/FixJ family response regulator
VDDSADIADLYQRLINRQEDMECVGTMESTVGLEEAIGRSGAEVAVVDLVAKGRDSMEAIGASVDVHPDCRVIVFSGHDDPATREEAARAGAWSLVSKHDEPMSLIREIRRAVAARR